MRHSKIGRAMSRTLELTRGMSALCQKRTCVQAFVLLDAKAVGIHKAEIESRNGALVVGGKLKRNAL